MPELPEVETTRRGIAPHLQGQHITRVVIRERRLRWPIRADLPRLLRDQTVTAIHRRGKYLLLGLSEGTLIIHLGMSGSLRLVPAETPAQKHDHVDLVLGSGQCLRLRDPRRFGALLWTQADPYRHQLLRGLGPEPWDAGFNSDYLYRRAHGRRQAIKTYIMDARTVAGVGNIYASEALFAAGIHPARAAGRIARPRLELLRDSIRRILEQAVAAGGTTLRDFQDSEGRPGYFYRQLQVYGRAGQACTACGNEIARRIIGQRASYYCKHCQH